MPAKKTLFYSIGSQYVVFSAYIHVEEGKDEGGEAEDGGRKKENAGRARRRKPADKQTAKDHGTLIFL